jgi:hypothetical protein
VRCLLYEENSTEYEVICNKCKQSAIFTLIENTLTLLIAKMQKMAQLRGQ